MQNAKPIRPPFEQAQKAKPWNKAKPKADWRAEGEVTLSCAGADQIRGKARIDITRNLDRANQPMAGGTLRIGVGSEHAIKIFIPETDLQSIFAACGVDDVNRAE